MAGESVMQIDNKEEYKEVPITNLNLSQRTINCLMRADLSTLYLIVNNYEKLPKIRNMGAKCLEEIDNMLSDISIDKLPELSEIKKETINKNTLPEDVLSRPASDLNVPVRICNAFKYAGIETISQVVDLTPDAIMKMRSMGTLSAQQLQEQIDLLLSLGEDYFDSSVINTNDNSNVGKKYSKRELDITTVKTLSDGYGFKSSWLCDWYGVSRQRIYQKLAQKKNYGNWCGKQLLLEEREKITKMINSKSFYQESNESRIYLLNNMKDDCAFIIVYEDDIKCFFLEDLPDALQALVKTNNMHKLSENEVLSIDKLGKKVYILKIPYFMPIDSNTFRNLAAARDMSKEDYSQFLFGVSYCSSNTSITDDRIIEFLEENTFDGITIIPSTPDNQWIRSYISRNNYTTDEFIKLYGFNSKISGDIEKLDFAEDDFNTIENDMQIYNSDDDYIAKIYAENPLLGSKLLSRKNLDNLYSNSRRYIDYYLANPNEKLSLKAEIQIALAVINYAKEWDLDDESGFWKFITSSFGYRDESGRLRSILCNCVKDALIRNRRWFVTNASGNQYKSTIVVHALTTKRSWLHFCDFLFDFYKTNLNWEYIEDDPMITRMVLALRNKLQDSEDINDEDIKINSKVFYFREGILKLFRYRPIYATRLVASLLKRIDDLVNHTEQPPKCYEEYLCDEWMTSKIQNVSSAKRKSTNEHRRVAIDYTRIKPLYRLCNEKDIYIEFPDIRLELSDFSALVLNIYHEEQLIEQRNLTFYGNELGKTMSGFSVNIEDYLRRSGSKQFDPQLVITCDGKEIYNSERVLFRNCIVFQNRSEQEINSCELGGYSFFIPQSSTIDFDNAEVGVIREDSFIKGYYAKLQKDYAININDELTAFDSFNSSEELRVIIPGMSINADYVLDGVRYEIISGKEYIHIVSSGYETEKKYRLTINGSLIDFNEIPNEKSDENTVYKLQIGKYGNNEISVRLLSLSTNRLVFNKNYIIINPFTYRFNRSYYFSSGDYDNARVKVMVGSEYVNEYIVVSGDSKVCVPYKDGYIEIDIPVIRVFDNSNEEWNGHNLYWIKNIPQERFLYIKAPLGLRTDIQLDGHSLGIENKDAFALGNAIYGYSDTDDKKWLQVSLVVSNDDQDKSTYCLGEIALKEQFINKPHFKTEGSVLSWDRGYGFIGDITGTFELRIMTDSNEEIMYDLKLNEDTITDKLALALGEYKYTICKKSGNLFSLKKENIYSGTLFVGDENELRFLNKIIQIDAINLELDGIYKSINIRKSYIDQIEYKGVQYCGSEDRECPVYSGVMYFISDSGKRHEYSYEDYTDEKGHQIYKVNPVRIVYINDRTLSITLDTGDPEDPGYGFYFYRFLNKYSMENIYQITDWEPTKFNKDKYYLADLYSYKIKEVQLNV